jgi:Zn-dependent alcohol dehydrogenase
VRRGRLSAREFVTHEFPVERIADALQAVAGGEVLKCLLRY